MVQRAHALQLSGCMALLEYGSHGVRPSWSTALMVHGSHGVRLSRCTALIEHGPHGVRLSRCSHGAQLSWSMALKVHDPHGVRLSRCTALMLHGWHGVWLSWCPQRYTFKSNIFFSANRADCYKQGNKGQPRERQSTHLRFFENSQCFLHTGMCDSHLRTIALQH